MPQKKSKTKTIEEAKRKLGQEIASCRETVMSQRGLAGAVGLPPSNMKYIEDGVNAPSADVYTRLISALKPELKQRKQMDHLYMEIRKTPPPDICKIINNNEEMVDAVRILDGQILTTAQIESMKSLFTSFAKENIKGDAKNETI